MDDLDPLTLPVALRPAPLQQGIGGGDARSRRQAVIAHDGDKRRDRLGRVIEGK